MTTVPKTVAERLVAGIKRFQPIFAAAKARDVGETDTVTIVKNMLADCSTITSIEHTNMKKAFIILASSTLLFGCNRDPQLQKQVVGNWKRDSNFQMTVSPDGSFVSRSETTNKSLTYQGTWTIQAGMMITTITNCVAEGYTNHQPVGTVDRFAILKANATELVYSYNNNQIISLKRQ